MPRHGFLFLSTNVSQFRCTLKLFSVDIVFKNKFVKNMFDVKIFSIEMLRKYEFIPAYIYRYFVSLSQLILSGRSRSGRCEAYREWGEVCCGGVWERFRQDGLLCRISQYYTKEVSMHKGANTYSTYVYGGTGRGA